MKKYDKILTIGLLIIIVFYFVLIKQLPERAARYPYFVLSLLIFLTVLLAIDAFFIKAKSDVKEEEKFKDIKLGQFLFIITASAAYIALIEIVGFFSITVVYLLAVMLGLKNSIKWSIVTSIIFPIFIYLIFVTFLRVPVPKGFLI